MHSLEAKIVLASASPRRQELLNQVGISHVQVSPDIDEAAIKAHDIPSRLIEVARQKAIAGRRMCAESYADLPVLAADTAVVCDGEEFGKPADRAQARQMLARLSSRSHWVYTAVIVLSGTREESFLGATRVWFKLMSNDDIEAYCDTGEPFDKAGAYGIQGLGARYVSRIEGCYNNVVGLPLSDTCELLQAVGVKL